MVDERGVEVRPTRIQTPEENDEKSRIHKKSTFKGDQGFKGLVSKAVQTPFIFNQMPQFEDVEFKQGSGVDFYLDSG